MIDVLEFLKDNKIKYVLHEHPAVFTCEEAEEKCGNIPGLPCKNLVLKDEKKNYFMAILPATKKLNFKNIAKLINAKKVSFANPETLQVLLGLDVGSVSPFGLLNDQDKEITLILDQEVKEAEILSFHPNVNTSTLELTNEMFLKFLKTINCNPCVFSF
jgi:Ala-tRNA(Pro) deacylase